ncbi:MAG: fructose transport system permease protein, partial [Nocardioidaceae bacterium]|nr:fructose transport system permease protein [Nocardioidaceae bacterium]
MTETQAAPRSGTSGNEQPILEAEGLVKLFGRVGGADPNAGLNYNLQSITAVVIGGTSLFGGRGLVVGSLIGALIVQVFNSGLALAGVDPNYQVLAT